MNKTWTFFSAHTQTRQAAKRGEIFAEFDKKCILLQSMAAPLTSHFIKHFTS